MLISQRYKFLFVHIPKTGGSSVRAVLTPFARFRDRVAYEWPSRFIINRMSRMPFTEKNGRALVTGLDKHARLSEAIDVLGPETIDGLWSFGFVRNPWDLQVSRYYYICRAKDHQLHSLATDMRFTEFLQATLKERPTNQVDFLLGPSGEVAVDFVGRYESLEEDFRRVVDRLGLPQVELPYINRSVNRPDLYPREYDAAARELVAERFEDDIDAFGYRFDA